MARTSSTRGSASITGSSPRHRIESNNVLQCCFCERKIMDDPIHHLINGGIMQRTGIHVMTVSIFLLAALLVSAAEPSAGVLGAEDLKRVVPASYFFRGLSASVQLRNSAGLRTSDGKFVLAGLVDTSGYATDVARKDQ